MFELVAAVPRIGWRSITVWMFLLLFSSLAVVACAAQSVPTPAKPAATTAPSAPALKTEAVTTPKPAPVTPTAVVTKPRPTSAPIKRGGTLRVALKSESTTLYPLTIVGGDSRPVILGLYDLLIKWEKDEKGVWGPAPELAESWDLQPKAVTLKLRKGVKFHDGSDFNAEVVAWNINRQFEPKSQVKTNVSCVDPEKKAEAIDPYTVKINMRGPCGPFLSLLGMANFRLLGMASKAAVEKLGDDEFGRHPVGTGPFEFVEWKTKDRVTLRKFNGYWQKGADGQPLPYLDGINFVVRLDPSVALLELKTNNLDFMANLEAKDFESVKADPNLVLLIGDWSAAVFRGVFSAAHGPFKDNLKLRQAALYAIDREALAKVLSLGYGKPSKYFLWPPTLLGYDESVPYYWYDLGKAKTLIREAGYPNGLDITLTVRMAPIEKRQGEMLQQMWDAIGIRTTIDSVSTVDFTSRVTQGPGEYDAAAFSNTSAFDPGPSLTDLLHSEGTFQASHYLTPEMDKCLKDGEATYDNKERHEIYKRCQQMDYENPYYAYLWSMPSNWLFRKELKGLEAPFSHTNFRFTEAWLDR